MREGFITSRIRSAIKLADMPQTINQLRGRDAELRDYRSLSACLTEMMKYGKPLLGRRKNKHGNWEYFIK